MFSRSNGQPATRTRLRFTPSSAAFLAAAASGLLWLTSLGTSPSAEAKTPGKKYCFLGICHRVETLEETSRSIGRNQVVKASHYDDPKKDRFNPSNLTSSGEWFRAGEPDNAASPKLPNGTILLAWNPASKKAAVLRINNAGPYWRDRTLDVSRAAAEKLGFSRQGVTTLHTKVVAAPSKEEATYRKGRSYAPVPGFLGTFESIDHALLDVGRSIHRLISPPVHVIAGRDPVPTYPTGQQPTRPGTLVADARGKAARPGKTAPAAMQVAQAQTPVTPSAASIATPATPDAALATIAATAIVTPDAAAQAVSALMAATEATPSPVQAAAALNSVTVADAAVLLTAPSAQAANVPTRARPLPPKRIVAKPAALKVAVVTPIKSQPKQTKLMVATAAKLPPPRLPKPSPAIEDDDELSPPARATNRAAVAVPAQVRRPVTAGERAYVSTECQAWPRPCDFASSRAGSSSEAGRTRLASSKRP